MNAARTLALVSALVALPASALGRERPTVATDAFMIGTRIVPRAALLASWDLDVYLTRDRALSLGPAVSVAVLGPSADFGAEQKLLVAVDVGRLKIGVNEAGAEWRPYFMIGGGFAYVHLVEQADPDIRIVLEPDDTEATGTREYEEVKKFLGMLSFGAGADLFVGGPWALTLAMTTHVRLGKLDRMPELWQELSAGIRFGL